MFSPPGSCFLCVIPIPVLLGAQFRISIADCDSPKHFAYSLLLVQRFQSWICVLPLGSVSSSSWTPVKCMFGRLRRNAFAPRTRTRAWLLDSVHCDGLMIGTLLHPLSVCSAALLLCATWGHCDTFHTCVAIPIYNAPCAGQRQRSDESLPSRSHAPPLTKNRYV